MVQILALFGLVPGFCYIHRRLKGMGIGDGDSKPNGASGRSNVDINGEIK